MNNLKQIGLSIHNYHASVNGLPWGHGYFGWNDWSATTLLLPYLEQTQVYNAINFANSGAAATPGSAQNQTVLVTTLNVFLCPSDIDRISNGYGHSNYCGNAGNCPNCFFGNNGENTGSNGVFFSIANGASTIGFNAIIDGLSQTVGFSEKVKGQTINGVTDTLLYDALQPTSAVTSLAAPARRGLESQSVLHPMQGRRAGLADGIGGGRNRLRGVLVGRPP